jgi:MFS family permease
MQSASDTNAVRTSGNSVPSKPWRPLRSSTFRNLLIANVVSDVGTFMQNVGAAWLMVSLNAGPMYVALTQTASALPFFVLALPAGAIGDIVVNCRNLTQLHASYGFDDRLLLLFGFPLQDPKRREVVFDFL